ncbi:unnamed protein product [Dracunculus medinensis]|uniref:DB domain-containing protein n=1 Tax=Dracunculus medinensis TaxID=318479 RepID=A0A0N4UCI0_DRAME|nr:unnamed protein product [Dracunculus medinensis]
MIIFLIVFSTQGNLAFDSINNQTIFDCNRVPISFCCTTRMQHECTSKCAFIECTPDFYKRSTKNEKYTRAPTMNRKIRNKFFLPPPPSTDTEALVDIESKDYDLESITSSDSDYRCDNFNSAKCGTAPYFTPCVPSFIADNRMRDCCRQKNLPLGCQNLCRYSVTVPEIKLAMDKALCGILHVAPIIECASAGHDNTQCCRYKGIAQKSGPQCEVFCRSGNGLYALGIQHLVCNKVMGELISCHHAGLIV